MYFRTPTKLVAGATLVLATGVLVSCNTGTASTTSPGVAGAGTASQSSSPAPVRESFTSPEYGYTVTLPAGWTAERAHVRWNGRTTLSSDSSGVDQFIGTTTFASSFGVAATWKRGLASYAEFLVAWNARYHGDTCPKKPSTEKEISIGGSPGVLLEYNCGILINIAGTVRHGVGYWFAFRDLSVHAASDPTDHAAFVKILRSVEFPH